MTVTIIADQAVEVSTKTAWADAWVEQPLLQALSISAQAAPGHGSAMLRYRYGIGMMPEIGSRAADDAPVTIPPGGFVGKYVKIVVPDLGIWYGIMQDVSVDRHGLLGGTVQSGVEMYTAFGLTWLLDQAKPITQTKVKYSGGTWVIDRAIPFNGGTDGRADRSKVAWKNFDATNKCFTDSAQSVAPTAWKAKDAIEYVLDNFGPKSSAGTVLVPFTLAAGALAFLDYEIPPFEYDGMTPWQLLSALIDRRRGLVMTSVISGSDVELQVSSQNAALITLPSGAEVPANPNIVNYNFDNAVNVTNATVTTTILTRYDQVVCRGERAGSVFTVRPQTNMSADWTSTQRAAYNTAASALTGYGSLSDADKEAANMDRRAADDLAAVFSWWRISKTWDGRSDTDPTSGSAPFALPKINADGVVDLATRANVQVGGLRFEDFIPLKVGVDYTGTLTPATEDSAAIDADYLPPILLLKASAIRASGDAGWVHCERLNAGYDSTSSKRPYSHSVDLAVRSDLPGLIFKVQGAPQHYIAQDQYTANASFEAIPSSVGINQNDWLATIYKKQDQYCRAQYPADADLPTLDLVRQLLIDVPGSYLDYVVPGTVVAVDGGEIKKTTAGGYVRDDRDRLKDISRLAFNWYGQTRRILNLSFKGIVSGFEVGHLVGTIGSGGSVLTINTAITSITYDLIGRQMSLSTQFGELDFTV